MIWFKIFLVFISCFLFLGIWTRLFASAQTPSVKNASLSKAFFLTLLQQILQPSLEQSLAQPLLQYRSRELSYRYFLLKVALAGLCGFPMILILWTWIYFLGLRGTFIEMFQIQTLSEPPLWSMWLGEVEWPQQLGLFLIGFIGTALVRRPFFAVSFVGVLTFGGVISIYGAVIALLGERCGLRWVNFKKLGELSPRKELVIALVLSIFMGVIFVLVGQPLVQLLVQLGLPLTFKPEDRLALITTALVLHLALESLVSLVIFHFYWLRYKGVGDVA